MTFAEVMDRVAQGFEALGATVLAIGTLSSFVTAGLTWRRGGDLRRVYGPLRQSLGGTVLLGLEILVAADLVRTIAVSPTVDNVLILGLIVLIRTFLSFSLETEINGTLPWRRGDRPGNLLGQGGGEPGDRGGVGVRRRGRVADDERGRMLAGAGTGPGRASGPAGTGAPESAARRCARAARKIRRPRRALRAR
jgi:uncharacterized membrane protein